MTYTNRLGANQYISGAWFGDCYVFNFHGHVRFAQNSCFQSNSYGSGYKFTN